MSSRVVAHLPLAGVLALTAVVLLVSSCGKKESMKPPVAERIAHVDTLFGQERVDYYYWLRDRSDTNVIHYLEAENAYTEAVMKPTEALQDSIYEELIGRIKETDLTVPVRQGDYYYYSRTQEGEEYRIYCRKKGSLEADEEVILDVNELAKGLHYCYLGVFEVSPDQNLLAYGIDTTGAESFTVYIKDLQTGQVLADTISNAAYSLKWANDNKNFFYTTRGDANRPDKVWRHTLGSNARNDKLIFLEEDERMYVDVSKTKDDAFLLVEMGSHTTTEAHYLDANNPDGRFQVITPRVQDVEYYVYHHGKTFYILTNENAINFKLMQVPDATPAKENWTELIAQRDGVTLDALSMFKDFMAVIQRQNGLQEIQIRNFSTGENHYIEWPEAVYSFSVHENPEFNSDKLRFTYQSLTTPRTVYDYDMNTRQRELLKEYEVLGGYDKTQYQAERVFATADDGTQVPISLVYKKGMKKEGGNPFYLYVYGAYGYSMDPYFSTNRISLLDRGFMFGIAHVRGGGEMGRQWYDDGKMLNKMNTFTDLIACSQYLIDSGYTARDKLIISGASAGGLTVGATVNMRPDLFTMVVADVPFVDVVNTMLDESIPLTVIEFEEWGNPKIKKYYDYMMKYSPYDNVKKQAYPSMLVTSSLNDPRVAFWEPAKWVAKLRYDKTDDNLLLLKTNMGAGHGGASGRYERYKEIAFEYTFIFDHFGIRK
jgi:oligopeptidase B